MRREFTHGSVRLIEVRDIIQGQRLIPAKQAYMIPLGTQECFETYFAPANRFEFVNTMGERMYAFETQDPTQLKIESETNFINVVKKPALIQKLITP
jgi:hypothetical protein